MATPTQSKVWVLQNKPTDAVNYSSGPDATFALKTVDLPKTIPDDSIFVKTLWLSNDPAQRGWIQKGADPKRLYAPPVQEGTTMSSTGIGKVLKVGGSEDTHKVGDLVLASTGWVEYVVLPKAASRVITPLPGLSPSRFLGPLGGSGLTAYWGLVDVLKLKAGETLVVSGAAGAVGNVAVQFAKKVIGTKVIAIVGSDDKAAYIKNVGADIALNYRSPNFEKEFIAATPDFVETFFDNVGGEILDLVLTRLKRHGRIAACGAISAYNDSSKSALKNYFEIIANRLELKAGHLSLDEGETLVEVKGLEEVPNVWHRLFEGKNQGKLVTKLPE